MTPQGHIRDRGITLLELVAAMAIFALVAVMGLQALSGAIRARDRLTEVDIRSAGLSRALTLLRRDLKAAAPLPFLPVGSDEAEWPFIDRVFQDGSMTFSVTGQPVLPDVNAAGQSRVIWRYDRGTGQLTRQVWPVLRPATSAAQAEAVVLLDNVTDFAVLAYAGKDDGWITGFGAQEDRRVRNLPKAVDVRLTSAQYGPMRVVVAY